MTSPFHRPYRTAEEIAEHKAQRLAEAVARKLEGMPEPKVPPYQGKTYKDLARHRELEIDITTDLGYGDPKAIWLMEHHAGEAVSRTENHARNWDWNIAHGGWKNLPEQVETMIEGLSDRIDPVLKVAEAEFDPEGLLRRKYDEIKAAHLGRVEVIKLKNDQMRDGAGPYARMKIRKQESGELQEVLDSWAKAVREWAVCLSAACKEAGLG